jgi:hypothetical protein
MYFPPELVLGVPDAAHRRLRNDALPTGTITRLAGARCTKQIEALFFCKHGGNDRAPHRLPSVERRVCDERDEFKSARL